jgi:DNA mismatch endonuclease (patch repair protein)
MRAHGIRFKTQVLSMPGKPDIVLWGRHVAIFCDGDFWHGRHWPNLRSKLGRGHNAGYWLNKIQGNIRRDRAHEKQLREAGWVVLRLWERDVMADPARAARWIGAVAGHTRPFQRYRTKQR